MFLANAFDEKLNRQIKRTTKIREHFFEAIFLATMDSIHMVIYIIQNQFFFLRNNPKSVVVDFLSSK